MHGYADLPLHWGKVPSWLIPIMKRMARAISDVILLEWGPEKFLERLSNPLWFQAMNNAIGMDWDSSGSTTVLISILKQVLGPEDGIVVVGGKGKSAMMVGQELLEVARRLPVDPGGLERISKLTAKVDNTLLQDGHQIYIHSLLLTSSGKWAVIQQGMNPRTRFARRYHWLNAVNFVNNPHEAVAGVKGDAVNVIDERTERTRGLILDLLREGPNRVLNLYSEARRKLGGPIDFWLWGRAVGAVEKSKKVIYYQPVDLKRVRKVLEGLRLREPYSLEDALLGGLGPSTARALFLIADLIYNEPPSIQDPVTHPYDPFNYAYAIGGKDGVPYPVNRRIAEEVISTLEDLILRAKMGQREKEMSMRKLRGLREGRSH